MPPANLARATAAPDYETIKQRQQAIWATGDYAVIGTTLQIVGEHLCEAIDLRAGERVLDIAAGNGNATLAAARRFAKVTSTDYVRTLLEHGKARADAERLPVSFLEADAEDLPFADGSFDVVLSTFGAMFTPDHRATAAEMSRVVRDGGRLGFANWTPNGFIGELFRIIGQYVPPPAGLQPPSLWGTEDHVSELFPNDFVRASTQIFAFRYGSPEHWLEVFRTFYGPMNRAFSALNVDDQAKLEADILALLRRSNRGGAGTLIVPSEYLEVVVTKQ